MSKIDLYDLRTFALKILASGMPIHKFANVVFAEYPHKCSEIAKFEHDMLLSNKQLFILENFLLNMFKQWYVRLQDGICTIDNTVILTEDLKGIV